MARTARDGSVVLAMRPGVSPLDRVLRVADAVRELKPIAIAAIRYINEIDAPNLREPFALANRRWELSDAVHALTKRGARKRAA